MKTEFYLILESLIGLRNSGQIDQKKWHKTRRNFWSTLYAHDTLLTLIRTDYVEYS